MTSSRWSKIFPCLLVAGLAWAPACGGDDDDEPAAGAGSGTGGSGTGGSGTGGSGTGGSGTGGSGMDPAPALNCASRCAAITATCGLSPDVCQNICSRATENQLLCAEMAGCNIEALDRCLATSSGTGGSGTGGSGTGGSGGGGLPDTVTITGRRDPADVVTTILSDDMTKVTTGLEGVASAAYSVTVSVKLQDAASVEVTSPSSNCADIDAMQWTLNPSQMSFAFTAQDALPATDCADFADDVVAGGVTARFTDVPVLNSSEKIKTLILEFKP